MADLVTRRVRRERSLRKKRVKAQQKSANIRKKYGPRRKPHPVVVKKMETGEVVAPRKANRKRSKRKRNRRSKYDAYLRSPAWQQRRKVILERDGHACRRCGSDKQLHVHHFSYEHVRNEPLTDLVTLCENCHEAHHRGAIVVTRALLNSETTE